MGKASHFREACCKYPCKAYNMRHTAYSNARVDVYIYTRRRKVCCSSVCVYQGVRKYGVSKSSWFQQSYEDLTASSVRRRRDAPGAWHQRLLLCCLVQPGKHHPHQSWVALTEAATAWDCLTLIADAGTAAEGC